MVLRKRRHMMPEGASPGTVLSLIILDWETLTAIYISRWGNVLTRKAPIKGDETRLKKKYKKIANIDFTASEIMNQPEMGGTHVKHACSRL